MQRLMGLVRRCVEDYDMITPGECIAVGVSGGKDSLVLLQLRKGGKPGLQLHERCLFDSQGGPTAYYREVYHM